MPKTNIQKATARRKRALSTFTSAVQELTVAEAELEGEIDKIDATLDGLYAQRFHAKAELVTTAKVRTSFADLLGIEG